MMQFCDHPPNTSLSASFVLLEYTNHPLSTPPVKAVGCMHIAYSEAQCIAVLHLLLLLNHV